MKKIISVITLSVALLFTGTVLAETKIAVVDVSSILQQMPERDKVIKTLEAEFKDRVKGLEQEEKKANEAAQKLQKEAMTLSNTQKTQLSNVIQSFQEKANQFSADYRKRENEEANKLLVKIEEAVTKIAKDKKYDLILKAEAAFYVVDSVDITKEVLAQVKK